MDSMESLNQSYITVLSPARQPKGSKTFAEAYLKSINFDQSQMALLDEGVTNEGRSHNGSTRQMLPDAQQDDVPLTGAGAMMGVTITRLEPHPSAVLTTDVTRRAEQVRDRGQAANQDTLVNAQETNQNTHGHVQVASHNTNGHLQVASHNTNGYAADVQTAVEAAHAPVVVIRNSNEVAKDGSLQQLCPASGQLMTQEVSGALTSSPACGGERRQGEFRFRVLPVALDALAALLLFLVSLTDIMPKNTCMYKA